MRERVLHRAKGIGAHLELLEHKVRIRRKGLLDLATHGFKGDKEILLSRISAIQFKDAGLAVNGYIQFTIMGGAEAKGGIWQATADENTVMFNRWQRGAFRKIKEAIEQRMITA